VSVDRCGLRAAAFPPIKVFGWQWVEEGVGELATEPSSSTIACHALVGGWRRNGILGPCHDELVAARLKPGELGGWGGAHLGFTSA
jgi:hypothetical protein